MRTRTLWLILAGILLVSLLGYFLFLKEKFHSASPPAGFAGYNRFLMLVGISDGYPWAAHDVATMKGLLKPAEDEDSFVSLDSAACDKQKIMDKLLFFAKKAHSGDIVYIYFSCHGTQIYDRNGDEKRRDSRDTLDEVMLLYNKQQIVDDEMEKIFKQFDAGVQVIFMADCCHSGSMNQVAPPVDFTMEPDVIDSLRAEILYLGACQDKALAKTDEGSYSKFTNALYNSARTGTAANYHDLFMSVYSQRDVFQQTPSYIEMAGNKTCEHKNFKTCNIFQTDLRKLKPFLK